MDMTFTRIRMITEELYLVRDELKRAAMQPAALSSALVEDEASNELVAFKAAVDELRQFLWHFLHDFLGSSDKAIGDRLHEYQMRRAAQLLLTLSSSHPYQIKLNPLEAAARDQSVWQKLSGVRSNLVSRADSETGQSCLPEAAWPSDRRVQTTSCWKGVRVEASAGPD